MKPWYASKIVWVNLITTLILILDLFTTQQGPPLLPPAVIPWIGIMVAILNIVLRVWFTSQPKGMGEQVGKTIASKEPRPYERA